jgi:transcriptional regulator with XRE-family HTH domain
MTTHEAICARLRAIRISKGLSLSDVEIASKRSIRAVVLGSYERGDRALSVKRAIEIAAFYGVPLTYLLEEPKAAQGVIRPPVIDLRQIRKIMADSQEMVSITPELGTIFTFISGIVALRNDWNGEVLSMRASDISLLAMTLGKNSDEISKIFSERRLLLSV